MNSPTNFAVVLAFILQVMLIVIHCKECKYTYYYSKELGSCVQCNKTCEAGEGLEENCGYDENGDKIPGKKRCKKCPDGWFSKYYEPGNATCKRCNACLGRPKGKRFKSVCKSDANAVCEDCGKGYYESNGECFPCQACCPGAHRSKLKLKCLRDGMTESCSCSASRNCGNNDQCQGIYAALMLGTVQITTTTKQPKTSTQRVTTGPSSTTAMIPSTKIKRLLETSMKTTEKLKILTTINSKQEITKKRILTDRIRTPLVRTSKAATLKKGMSDPSISSKSSTATQQSTVKAKLMKPERFMAWTSTVSPPKHNKYIIEVADTLQSTGKAYINHTTPATRKETQSFPKSSLNEILLLVAALVGVLIFVVLAVAFTKFRKNCRRQTTQNKPSHKEVKVQLTTNQEEGEMHSQSYFPAEPSKGLKAVVFEPKWNDDEEGVKSIDHLDYLHMSFTKAEKEDYKSKSSQIHGQTKLKNHQMNPELTRSARYRHNPLVESDSSKDTAADDSDTEYFRLEETEEDYDESAQNSKCTNQLLGATKRCSCGVSCEEIPMNTSCQICGQFSCNEYSKVISCEKRLEELRECQKKILREKLDLESEGVNNWKAVAEYFGVYFDTITTWKTRIKAGESPTESLMCYLNTKNVTVVELLICLKKLARLDAHKTLIKHLTNKCCICKLRCRKSLV